MLMSSVLPQQLFRNTSRHAARVNLPAYSSCVYQNVTGPRFTKRLFHASQASQTSRDQSTIDFAYFPQEELETPAATFAIRVPILPNNYTESHNSGHQEPTVEFVRRPEIYTVSADGTHIDNPSAMSDVVDNHAADIDHFDLIKHVTNAASKVAKASTEHLDNQDSAMKSFWNGLLDDVFGEKKAAHV